MKKIMSAMLISSSILVLASCTTHPENSPRMLAPGEYTDTQKSTNAQGTMTEKTTNTIVYKDKYGNKRAIQETQTSKDPNGLFNKSTSTKTQTYD